MQKSEANQIQDWMKSAIADQQKVAQEGIDRLTEVMQSRKFPKLSMTEPQALIRREYGQDYLIFNTAAVAALIEKFPQMAEVIRAIAGGQAQ